VAGLEPSVGTVGDAYDNALAETMIGLFKADVIHRLGPWKSAHAVEWETLNWVDLLNNRRLLEPIGYITPAEAEEAVYANMNACRYRRVRRPKQSPVKPGRFSFQILFGSGFPAPP
jgi:putative transposase